MFCILRCHIINYIQLALGSTQLLPADCMVWIFRSDDVHMNDVGSRSTKTESAIEILGRKLNSHVNVMRIQEKGRDKGAKGLLLAAD